ncbi:MAG: class I SAM-dependent methyltransferase [Candidatus Binatia bacterium]
MRNYASEIKTKMKDSLHYRGVVGTVRACIRSPLRPILDDQRVINFWERRFDRRFGVDTAGIIPREDLKIDGPSAAHAIHYQAAHPVLLEQTVAGLRIKYPEYTFVDFGCGKGKALLLASSFPFKTIVGVELSAELVQTAASNWKKYKSRKQRCITLELAWMDAAKFPIPETPLVCFFYNPFREEIMARVLKNIEESVKRNPRDLIIVYLYPEAEHLFEKKSFLVNVRRRAWCSIYRNSAPSESNGVGVVV